MNGYSGGPGGSNSSPSTMGAEDEMGAGDNMLMLNPNDPQWKDAVNSWADGKTYTFNNVRVEQVSPGQYKVLSAEAGEASEPPHDESGEQGESGAQEKGGSGSATNATGSNSYSDNPAVSRMMES